MSHVPIRSVTDAVIAETEALTGPLVGAAVGRVTALTPLISESENVANPFGLRSSEQARKRPLVIPSSAKPSHFLQSATLI